jgi:REP element-mobilizing transposase RayT
MTEEMTPEESGPGVPPVSVETQSGTGVPPVSDETQSGTGVPPVSHETEKTGGTPVPLFQPLDQDGLIVKHRRTLPHWEQSGCSYFVTFRLADSLPPAKLKYLRDWKKLWLQQQPKPWTDRTFRELETYYSRRIEHWLDNGLGGCCLRTKELRDIVVTALEYYHRGRYVLHSFVVMPNHVHVLLRLSESISLAKVVHSWKSYTAHQILPKLNRREPLWMSEYFDHIVRSERQLDRLRWYIRDNPLKARLRPNEYSYRSFH